MTLSPICWQLLSSLVEFIIWVKPQRDDFFKEQQGDIQKQKIRKKYLRTLSVWTLLVWDLTWLSFLPTDSRLSWSKEVWGRNVKEPSLWLNYTHPGRLSKQWQFCTAFFLLCWLLIFQPFNRIILKCHPSASPFNGKLKGSDSVGGPNFVPILSVPHLSVPVYRLCKSLVEIWDVVKMMQ